MSRMISSVGPWSVAGESIFNSVLTLLAVLAASEGSVADVALLGLGLVDSDR